MNCITFYKTAIRMEFSLMLSILFPFTFITSLKVVLLRSKTAIKNRFTDLFSKCFVRQTNYYFRSRCLHFDNARKMWSHEMMSEKSMNFKKKKQKTKYCRLNSPIAYKGAHTLTQRKHTDKHMLHANQMFPWFDLIENNHLIKYFSLYITI